MSNYPKIGVFDSGVGGKSVANAIERRFPGAEVVFVNDAKNLPYGSKTPEELVVLVEPVLQKLAQRVDVIVVACNTVSTTLIRQLRAKISSTPLIAMEPMVKPAAKQTKSGVIAVCATPGTLRSARYAWLKETYAKQVKVLEPDCSDWSYMIENNQVDQDKIATRISAVCEEGADVVVLGCTHYHWIEKEIQEIANRYNAKVLQSEQPVIDQLARVLAQLS